MADEEWGFAPPPFKADEALQRLKRDLRELGLTERSGVWERRGQAIAKAAVRGDVIEAQRVKRPGRSPEWVVTTLKQSAHLRDWVAELKRQLAGWTDRDD